MVFFVIDAMFIVTNILFALGFIEGMCGFFKLGRDKIIVNSMMLILGILWSIIALATILATFRIHRLYRQSGATLEQAQKDFQTAFVNNSTVRGAAREVATAGINEALHSDRDNQPIY
jgi:ABC-type multidrug transport system fused ATPase/permease subunit